MSFLHEVKTGGPGKIRIDEHDIGFAIFFLHLREEGNDTFTDTLAHSVPGPCGTVG